MGQVALFFMRRDFGGGSTSYTVHLYLSLKQAGYEPSIFRVTANGDGQIRPFSKYEGASYRNVTFDESIRIIETTPSIMTGACPEKDLWFRPTAIIDMMKAGMRCVVHDPNEFKIYDHARYVERPIIIRPTMRRFYNDSVFIQHPYVPWFKDEAPPLEGRPLRAVSIARVTFVKRTEWILDANRLLHEDSQVVLRGAENRLYTRHKILDQYPEYQQGSTGYPLVWGAGPQECAKAKFAVDMTYFPDDGGGSQYSFMEAWDAGTINIVPRDWLRYEGEMQEAMNCISVDGPQGLADALTIAELAYDLNTIRTEGRRLLREYHSPEVVAEAYAAELGL
jgi:hypothetical protein